jgi:hypothetical protein
MEIFVRRQKNNPVLVGDAGVKLQLLNFCDKIVNNLFLCEFKVCLRSRRIDIYDRFYQN